MQSNVMNQSDVTLKHAHQEALIPKWESTGLLIGCTTLQEKRTMAQLLETQGRQMIFMKEHNEDGTVMPVTKMPELDRVLAMMLPLVARIYQPIISSIGAMDLPAGLSDMGSVMVSRTIPLPTEIPYISEMNTYGGYSGMDNEAEYISRVSDIIRNDIINYIELESNKVDKDIQSRYYAYVPFILVPMMNSELQYTHYKVIIRGAIDRIFPEQQRSNT